MNKWIIFESDYKDSEGKEFKKGTVIQLNTETADSLIKSKHAKETEAPKAEDIIAKALEPVITSIKESVEKSQKDFIEGLNKSFKGLKIPAIAKDEKLEKMGGFHSTGDYVAHLIKSSAPGATVDPRLIKAPSGQSTIDDVTGGFLVPEEVESQILEVINDDYDGLDVLGETDQRYTSGESLKINTMPETSRKDGYRSGGAIAYWLNEAGAFTSSTLKWGQERLELNKVIALFYATDEEMADASVALDGVFTRKAGEALRFKTRLALFDGTGVGQPLGILRANAMLTVPLASGQSSTTASIQHRNINAMYNRMLPSYLAGARWYAHPNLIEQLEYVTFNDDSTNQRPIYTPPGGGGVGNLSVAPFGSLKGRPVVAWEYCYDFGQRGDLVLANWKAYTSLQKRSGGVKYATSIHVRFLYEEQAFRFSYRIDGKPSLVSPVEDLHGTTKRSAFVCLAARTSEGSSSGL